MKHLQIVKALAICIIILAAIAASSGIWSEGGSSPYEYTSIRGEKVIIYGQGLYKHMSADVAPQRIAQDVVTLFAGIPLLLLALISAWRGSMKGRLFLAGVLGYFLVTYVFYLVMGMYNYMFLAYVILSGLSFFSFLLIMLSFKHDDLPAAFRPSAPVKLLGAFLIFNAVSIAILWLAIIVPPLLNGTVIPVEVDHYTTLIVQGLDLSILLPAAAVIGWLLMKRKQNGYLFAPVYFVFLSLLMAALAAKIAAMGMLGYSIIPAVFIIPAFFIVSLICTITLFRNILETSSSKDHPHVRQ